MLTCYHICCVICYHPLPTTHLKAIVGVIAPFLTSLFNKSLLRGYVPDAFKVAYITPLVKKTGMDTTDVRSYRPISNLSVTSKLLERIAAKRLIAYLEKSALLPRLQSAVEICLLSTVASTAVWPSARPAIP